MACPLFPKSILQFRRMHRYEEFCPKCCLLESGHFNVKICCHNSSQRTASSALNRFMTCMIQRQNAGALFETIHAQCDDAHRYHEQCAPILECYSNRAIMLESQMGLSTTLYHTHTAGVNPYPSGLTHEEAAACIT